jgi:hypothetical protein
MLEQKIKLKHALENGDSRENVQKYFDAYEEAFKRLHKPSPKHIRNYKELSYQYSEYINKQEIKRVCA